MLFNFFIILSTTMVSWVLYQEVRQPVAPRTEGRRADRREVYELPVLRAWERSLCTRQVGS
jgi:hypothetical protein